MNLIEFCELGVDLVFCAYTKHSEGESEYRSRKEGLTPSLGKRLGGIGNVDDGQLILDLYFRNLEFQEWGGGVAAPGKIFID